MNEDWVDEHVTLWGNCGEFALRPGWWPAILGLARQQGWCPQGTQPPRDYSGWEGDPTAWDGRYWPGRGQQVTGADARHLGRALARALADIPRPHDGSARDLLSGAEFREVLGWFLQHCAGCVLRHCDGCVLPPSDGGCQHCKSCVLLQADDGYGCCGDGGFDIIGQLPGRRPGRRRPRPGRRGRPRRRMSRRAPA
jgi:hypothetical protein